MGRLNGLDWLAMLFVIIGGINWGLVGFFNFDLVASILGPMSMFSRVIYGVVGISAVYMIYLAMKVKKQ